MRSLTLNATIGAMVVSSLVLHQVYRYIFKDENGEDPYRYPFAVKMEVSNPLTHVAAEKSNAWRACERAFELAIRISCGRGLVEEFLASGVWPLGHNTWKEFTCVGVALPLYASVDCVVSSIWYSEG